MRHYVAKQRVSDGRWDYTCGSSPVGYCCNERLAEVFKGEGLWIEGKHHVDAHATREEAEACYKAYLLDTRTRESAMKDQMGRCRVCGEFTTGLMCVGAYQLYILCDAHRNREALESLVVVGQSWES